MKNYELLVVFKPNSDADELDKLIAKISDDLESFGGKTETIEKIGRKKLAYEIKSFRDGYFTNILFELPEDKVSDFKRQLRLNDTILRTMFLEKSAKTGV